MARFLGACLVLCAGFLACGCSQPLRTLMDLDAEQKAQQRYVNSEDAKFAVLVKDIKEHRLQPGGMKHRVIARYGEPVVIQDKTFLYRRAQSFFPKTKVYLTFDDKDVLKKINLEE